MNPQQQQGPSTPQRVFAGSPMNQQGLRPQLIPNPAQTALFNANRSYSPQTPSQTTQPLSQQQQQQQQQAVQFQQQIRTPIQLMQQQTQSISNSPISNAQNSNSVLVDSIRKRPFISSTSQQQQQIPQTQVNNQTSQQQAVQQSIINRPIQRKKGKLRDKVIPQKVRELVPDSQSYMDLLAFERKLDATIMRKRLDIQEALKRPMKTKRKLRVFITNQFYPGKVEPTGSSNTADNDEDCVPQWELKIEGRLVDENNSSANSFGASGGGLSVKAKPRKFSSFFKSLVIELDKELYGPDNHLVEWHRTPQTAETDGFQVKRHGDQSLKCTILMLLDYQPPQFKLDQRLAKLLGIHTATRPVIIQSLWQYIKVNHLQDNQEKEFINLDKYLQQIFECERIRFSEIPNKLHMHCMPPDPIVINHMINIEGVEPKRTSIYDIDVEIDDSLRDQMKSFLNASQTQSLAEVAQLDARIHEQIEQINQLRLNRDFFMNFSEDPQDFINKWLISQSNDLKNMLDLNGNPEEERKAQFYYEPWTDEAVCRYFYNKVQQRRAELEQVLGMRS